ncbi:Uncharacterized protein PBTT_03357 [Plasmodiophora brassicae]|uniref:Uncharacterized protein n=1 Tax=Plasmodiophora brassicae TaxID=37360 RepID=A0A0G4IIW6_PLABS|nr:hypothetical protein PBRA_003904 [Plasmodiophora brassicae]SPQ96413.1 unnamed protein product [Plasmodiophora brassicae]
MRKAAPWPLLAQLIADLHQLAARIPSAEYRRKTRRAAHFLDCLGRKLGHVHKFRCNLELQGVTCIDLVFRHWKDEIYGCTNVRDPNSRESRHFRDALNSYPFNRVRLTLANARRNDAPRVVCPVSRNERWLCGSHATRPKFVSLMRKLLFTGPGK